MKKIIIEFEMITSLIDKTCIKTFNVILASEVAIQENPKNLKTVFLNNVKRPLMKQSRLIVLVQEWCSGCN